jgi:hypothetical protein
MRTRLTVTLYVLALVPINIYNDLEIMLEGSVIDSPIYIILSADPSGRAV